MTVTFPPYLVDVLNSLAAQRGVTPEELAIGVLGYELDAEPPPPLVPRDEWERRMLAIGETTGVPVADPAARTRALSSEGLYD